ncbi:MAG TPA: hypothetical protein VFD37_06455 [Solirubrobacterales bacterium]|nr:hypothetical protein [Solirubrobacterales bacterium]
MARRKEIERVTFLADRSLGKSIAIALREVDLDVRAMDEVYGDRDGQRILDEDWLRDAGRNGWAVLTKDKRIRRRELERDALTEAKVRVFCLTTGKLTGDDQIERFVSNRFRIVQRARKPGPYICGVYRNEVRTIWPA